MGRANPVYPRKQLSVRYKKQDPTVIVGSILALVLLGILIFSRQAILMSGKEFRIAFAE